MKFTRLVFGSAVRPWRRPPRAAPPTFPDPTEAGCLAPEGPPSGPLEPTQAYDPETGEIVSHALQALEWELQLAEATVAGLRRDVKALNAMLEQRNRELADLPSLRFRMLELERLAAEVPTGAMKVCGRLVRDDRRLAVVPLGGHAIRLSLAPGWDMPGSTGDAVVVEAHLSAEGFWKAWQLTPLGAAEAAALPELDPKIVERLTAPRQPRAEPESAPSVENLDHDRQAKDLLLKAHNASAIALHIVMARHRRGVGVPLSDEQAVFLRAQVANVVSKTLGWKLLAVNTGSIDAAHKHDHLHLAVGHVDPAQPISREIGRLKAISAKRMREHFPELAAHEKFWSGGFYAGSFGGPNKDAVLAYVANQEQ